MFTSLNRTILVAAACLLALVIGFFNAWQNAKTAVEDLSKQVSTLTTERDDARNAQALQVFQFNRVNRITQEAHRANQQTTDQAEHLRHEVHASISSQSCHAVLLPVADSDRLLRYVTWLRQDALHPDAGAGSGPDRAGDASRRLTWGQAVEWLPLLLGNLQTCNEDKAAIRRIDEERANEHTSTQ